MKKTDINFKESNWIIIFLNNVADIDRQGLDTELDNWT